MIRRRATGLRGRPSFLPMPNGDSEFEDSLEDNYRVIPYNVHFSPAPRNKDIIQKPRDYGQTSKILKNNSPIITDVSADCFFLMLKRTP